MLASMYTREQSDLHDHGGRRTDRTAGPHGGVASGRGTARRVRARILIEASTESKWVARYLKQLGHDVIVADPNFAPRYATRQRKVKTDRRGPAPWPRHACWARTGRPTACPTPSATSAAGSPYATRGSARATSL